MMINYLVGGIPKPLWTMMERKSVGMMKFPTEWEKNICSKPPTRKDVAMENGDLTREKSPRNHRISPWNIRRRCAVKILGDSQDLRLLNASTLWLTDKKLLKMAIEIVDFPLKMVIFHGKMLVQRVTCFLIITSRFQMVENSSRVGIPDQTRFFFPAKFKAFTKNMTFIMFFWSGTFKDSDVKPDQLWGFQPCSIWILTLSFHGRPCPKKIVSTGRLTDLTDPLLTETRLTADLAKRCVFQILWSWEAGRLHAMPRRYSSRQSWWFWKSGSMMLIEWGYHSINGVITWYNWLITGISGHNLVFRAITVWLSRIAMDNGHLE